jgi:hypothetical protein
MQLNLIHNALFDVISACESKADYRSVAWSYRWMKWRQGWVYWGLNRPISTMIDDKFRAEGSSAPSHALAGFLNEDLKNLNQSAFTTIWKGVSKDSPTPLADIRAQYPDIIQRAAHDIGLIFNRRFKAALDATLRPDLMQGVDKLLTEVLKPVDDLIPGPLKDIFDPVRTGLDIISDVLESTENVLIEKMLAALLTKVREQGERLAAQGCSTKAV